VRRRTRRRRKAEAWALRATRRVYADSLHIVSVHCGQEEDATHTVSSSLARAQARAGFPRGAFAAQSAAFKGGTAAASA
jgi:hypothetical protein